MQAAELSQEYIQNINKPDSTKAVKPTIPLQSSNNIIFLLEQFEKFWEAYPLKKSKQQAEDAFKALSPDEELLAVLLTGLEAQKKEKEGREKLGLWAPNWKHPANWLREKCWEDEIQPITIKETKRGNVRNNSKAKNSAQFIWGPSDEQHEGIIIEHNKQIY